MQQSITRQELIEKLKKYRLNKTAKLLNISSVKLSQICKQHNIEIKRGRPKKELLIT